MRYAIFSDIHGNLPAWEQVLADIRASKADVLICLGDVVGYGPKPQEVLDGIRAVTDHFVLGNHDAAAAGIIDPSLFNDHAHAVVLWTREALSKEALKFLKEVPLELETPDLLFVHAEVSEPGRFGYIQNEADARENFATRNHFISFVGHTHYPECFERLKTGVVRKLGDRDRVLEPKHRYIINVGSVGEPRDANDIRARYVLYDDETREIQFRRIDFDPNVYRDQLRATSLTHSPYFIRVLDDQAAAVAEVQDMEVLVQAVSSAATNQRILLTPGKVGEGNLGAVVQKIEVTSVQSGENSMKRMAMMMLTILALIGGLLFWINGRSENEMSDTRKKGVDARAEDGGEESKNPKMLAETESPSKEVVADPLPKPVFYVDARRPKTWQPYLPGKSKRPKLIKYGVDRLSVLEFDGKDDFLHAKPVLKAGDDTFTYIALLNPRSITRSQVICEQAGKGEGERASLQFKDAGFFFNGNGNDSEKLGGTKRDKWQLIALVSNGRSKDNLIAIHNSSPPMIDTIDVAKQKVGAKAFRVGHRVFPVSENYRGRLAELQVYNQALSSVQLEELLARLQNKWGTTFEVEIPEMEVVK